VRDFFLESSRYLERYQVLFDCDWEKCDPPREPYRGTCVWCSAMTIPAFISSGKRRGYLYDGRNSFRRLAGRRRIGNLPM
jgi:hypothetical protein